MAFADLHSQTLLAISSIFILYYNVLCQGSTLLPAFAAYPSAFQTGTKYDENYIPTIGRPSRVNASWLL